MGIYESRDMDRLLDDVHKDALELLINWLNNYFSDLPHQGIGENPSSKGEAQG